VKDKGFKLRDQAVTATSGLAVPIPAEAAAGRAGGAPAPKDVAWSGLAREGGLESDVSLPATRPHPTPAGCGFGWDSGNCESE